MRVSTSASVQPRLLGAHVLRRPHERAELGVHRFRRQPRAHRFRDAEVDHLDDWPGRRDSADQDVGGLQIPVNHALLMGVLDRLADLQEQLEPCRRSERALVRDTS